MHPEFHDSDLPCGARNHRGYDEVSACSRSDNDAERLAAVVHTSADMLKLQRGLYGNR